MLLQFGVSNFRSIRGRQELLLTTSRRLKRSGPATEVPAAGEAVVPVAVIFGANASGKTSLVAAIAEMRRLIAESHVKFEADAAIPRQYFRFDEESVAQPTAFDCTFTVGSEAAADRVVYDYGFEFTERGFRHEWLRRTVRMHRRTTQMVFERRTDDGGNVQVRFGSRLRGENQATAKLTRPNSLFLSAAAQNNHPDLGPVHRYLVRGWTVLADAREIAGFQVAERVAKSRWQGEVLELLKQADFGITELEVRDADSPGDDPSAIETRLADLLLALAGEVPQLAPLVDLVPAGPRIELGHVTPDGGSRALEYEFESHGTRMLLSLLLPALDALSSGSLLVVDELDASLHSRLSRAFLGLFKSDSSRNGAQLVCTTHDTALLEGEALDLDEIWLAEKGSDGSSVYTPVTDFELRSRDDVERVYRRGRLGGVPAVTEFLFERLHV